MSDFRSKTNLLDRRRCFDEPVTPTCWEHHWKSDDFGRKLVCLVCGEIRCAENYAPLHHRSCHLKRGGNVCTC